MLKKETINTRKNRQCTEFLWMCTYLTPDTSFDGLINLKLQVALDIVCIITP